jgi:predicted RNA-binding Zn ribbon-like protein
MASNPAPGELELVRTFVNTYDAEDGSDQVAEPAALGAWLSERGLLPADHRVSPAEHRRARDVRSALHATLRSHHGDPLPPEAPQLLEDAACRARLAVRFSDRGCSRLEPRADGVDGALGRLLAIAHEADVTGTWSRLKVCPADDCLVAFYDQSRNRSGVWCDMAVCGNRAKVREYRERVRPARRT